MNNKLSNTMRIDLIPGVPTESVAGNRERSAASSMESKSVRADARQSGSRYRDLLESIYDAVVITDLTGLIDEVNRRAVEFLQYAAQDLNGNFVGDVVLGATPELMTTLLENLDNERFTLIQAHCRRRDDSTFPAEIAVSRLRFGTERLCFFVRDITVRRQAEEMLRTEHNALQNAGTGIGIANLRMQLKYANPALARMLGYADPGDLTSVPVGELLWDATDTDKLLGELARGHRDWGGEVTVRKADGERLAVQLAAACNRSADGEAVGFVFSFVDLTDRRSAERATREAERHRVMIESLGAACHHLGQPATVLTANLGLIQSRLDSSDPLLDGLVDGSLVACRKLADILHKMNAVAVYKTTDYLAGDGDTESAERILQL
jgi:PAS domain S-box-containing protein